MLRPHPLVLLYCSSFAGNAAMWVYILRHVESDNRNLVRNLVISQGIYWIFGELVCRTPQAGTMVTKEYGSYTSYYAFCWHLFSHVACGLAMWTNFHVIYFPINSCPTLPIILTAISICGVILRIWSMRVLGKFFSRQLRLVTDGNHEIIDSGPYSLVRHPGYLATLLVFFPLAVASTQDIFLTLLFCSIFFIVYEVRMNEEEDMLVSFNKESYTNYKENRVKFRVIPCFY